MILWKEALRSLFCPLAGLLLGALLLFSFLSGFLDAAPQKKAAPSQEEEFRLLEDALLEASRNVARAKTEEEKLPFRASVLFYKMAMEHSFPVWESAFYSEALTRLATLSVAAEKSEEMQSEIARLETILFQEDREGFLLYLEEKLREDPTLSESEIALQIEQNQLLFLKDIPESGGREELLEDILLLRKSLFEGKNHFHLAAKSAPLRSDSAAKLEALLNFKIHQFQSEKFPSAPANDQTLRSGEAFLSLLLVLALLFLFAKKEKEEALPPLGIRLAFFFAAFLSFFVPVALALFFTTVYLAPDAAQPVVFFTQKAFVEIPFFFGLLCRLLLRFLSFLPFVLPFFLGKKKAFFAKLSALLCIAFYLFGLGAPFFGGPGIRIGFLFNLADSLFPSPSRYTLLPQSPLWAALIFLILCAAPFLIAKKIKKRT